MELHVGDTLDVRMQVVRENISIDKDGKKESRFTLQIKGEYVRDNIDLNSKIHLDQTDALYLSVNKILILIKE